MSDSAGDAFSGCGYIILIFIVIAILQAIADLLQAIYETVVCAFNAIGSFFAENWIIILLSVAALIFTIFIISLFQNAADEAKNERDRSEAFQREKAKRDQALNSSWWNFPPNSNILIDTNIFMSNNTGIDHWFSTWYEYNPSCKLIIFDCVISELKAKEQHPNKTVSYSARNGLRRLMVLQNALLEKGKIVSSQRMFKKIDNFADPQLIEYISKEKNTVLITNDKELIIKARFAIQNSLENKNSVICLNDFKTIN